MTIITHGKAAIDVELMGAPGRQACVLMLPSLGRSRADFTALATSIAAEGFGVLLPDPRGIGNSTGPLEDITLFDLAGDAAAVISALAAGPVTVLGHAFGNRVARCVATAHPALVDSVCLLGAGGMVEPDPEALAAFKRFFNDDLEEDGRREAMRIANFSPDSDPAPWLSGWWPETARLQAAAAAATPRESWWQAGTAPLLVIQGADDRMALPENGRALAAALGPRARVIEIAAAGHALLPEQPARVEAAVLAFLAERYPQS